MIVGHYAASFAAKAIEPRVPLWHYIVAAQLIDFAWAVFVLTGIEKARIADHFTKSFPFDFYYMPYSHSLSAVLCWSALTYVTYCWLLGKQSSRAALVLALVVSSHWLLDLLVHPGDLPLFSVSTKVGFWLWNLPWVALVLEVVMVVVAFTYYSRERGLSIKATVRILTIIVASMFAIHALFHYNLNPQSIVVISMMILAGYSAVAYLAHYLEQWVDPDAGP